MAQAAGLPRQELRWLGGKLHRVGAADYLEAALQQSKGDLGTCRSRRRFLKFECNDVDAWGIVWP